ncbi:hypothetical protein [Clostridium septicum]|uniref:Uncharacterized protein n=1 Tax=Clostridium septicum TaxID=1504 RepID=A0A9N7PJZ5_CLOSE|nr:hypothetical protein [Clostridium septicum]AYE35115.1 hypothetical protein CP523_12195 [Clostridium septicum]MDU1314213.1 hypothetical protein [Clostridium septicum]QAS60506.1 hypothetical protein EI377_07015 [Clostridium septicum]UEC20234.1 hypothetical protein LK444_12615 [Clostridium septicum]USS01712.1 hypothetical protein NH397_04570 [Clostridium septicum]
MVEEYISAIEASKKFNLYLKVVNSVSTFDSYNSFFNIFDQYEEYCRRIVILTPYKELEEVYEVDPGEKIEEAIIREGNMWIKEYPLTTKPEDICMESLFIPKELLEKIL